MERKWVARTTCPGEREPIARKPHYAPLHKAKLNRTPAVWVGTIGPDVTFKLGNRFAKYWKIKNQFATLETPHLLQSGTQWQNSQHRPDPHGEGDTMACAFDLQCHQLTKIMGHQWAGPLTRYLLQKNCNISADPKDTKLVPIHIQESPYAYRKRP
jgi:hypothetical protein